MAAKFLDYDNDGWIDILQLNGAMLDNVSLYHSEVSYKEPLLMFRNLGHGHFENVVRFPRSRFSSPGRGSWPRYRGFRQRWRHRHCRQ